MTAVERLLSELQIRLLTIKSEPDGIVRETMINNFLLDTEQAKEMEKELLAKTWNNAIDAELKDAWMSFEQYYNETFKN